LFQIQHIKAESFLFQINKTHGNSANAYGFLTKVMSHIFQ
jgi:hypothetical protein